MRLVSKSWLRTRSSRQTELRWWLRATINFAFGGHAAVLVRGVAVAEAWLYLGKTVRASPGMDPRVGNKGGEAKALLRADANGQCPCSEGKLASAQAVARACVEVV